MTTQSQNKEEPSFIVKLTFEELEKVENQLKKKGIPYDLFVWSGYFPKERAKYFVHYGVCMACVDKPSSEWCNSDSHNDHWFGTIDNIQKADDGVLCDIMRPDKPVTRIPNIMEIFIMEIFKFKTIKLDDKNGRHEI